MPGTNSILHVAGPSEAARLLPLVADYHAWEGIETTEAQRQTAVAPLLTDPGLGRVFLISGRSTLAGYIAITFGWSIEMGGRDGFVDEFYLKPEFRGRGLGRSALVQLPALLAPHDLRALHLEVATDNSRAQNLYASAGFLARRKYHLMSRLIDDGLAMRP